MTWLSAILLFIVLGIMLVGSVLLGMGRHGWAQVRHEMRKRRAK